MPKRNPKPCVMSSSRAQNLSILRRHSLSSSSHLSEQARHHNLIFRPRLLGPPDRPSRLAAGNYLRDSHRYEHERTGKAHAAPPRQVIRGQSAALSATSFVSSWID